MKLTWPDLLIQDISAEAFQRWLQPWSSVIGGRVAPAFMNQFGTWFLRRPEGHVEMLDVFTGEVSLAADTYEQFVADVNDVSWQEVYLLSPWSSGCIKRARSRGRTNAMPWPRIPLGGPNPLAGDEVDTRFVMVLDIALRQDLCARAVLGPEP